MKSCIWGRSVGLDLGVEAGGEGSLEAKLARKGQWAWFEQTSGEAEGGPESLLYRRHRAREGEAGFCKGGGRSKSSGLGDDKRQLEQFVKGKGRGGHRGTARKGEKRERL